MTGKKFKKKYKKEKTLDLKDCDTVGKRIRYIREQKGLTLREFVAEIDLKSHGGLSAIEKGSRNVADSTIRLISLKFHASQTWIKTGEGKPFTEPEAEEIDVEIPIIARAGATDEIGRTAFEPLYPPYETASFKGCKAVVIDSNSMAPVAYKGQKIIYSEIEKVREGDLVYVKLKTGEQLFKRYNTGNSYITLSSVNPVEFHSPLIIEKDKIEFYYKVVGVRF